MTLSPTDGAAVQTVNASISGLQAGTTYHYRLTATNSGGTKPGLDMTFSTIAESPVVTWLRTNGFPANADLQSDPNGDGVNLLLAYALALDPQTILSGNLPKPVVATNQMSITFYAGNADVTYTVESSADLKIWNTNGVTTVQGANNLRTATISINPGTQRFMRLSLIR